MSSEKKTKRPRRLVVRLTAWHAAVLLATALAFSAFLYVRLRHDLYKQHDKFVQLNSKDFAGEVAENAGTPALIERELKREVGPDPRPNIAYRLYGPDARVLLQSEGFPGYPPDTARMRQATQSVAGPLDPWTARGPKGYPYRMTAQAVRINDKLAYVIESGYSLRPIIKTVRNYQKNFVRFLLPLVGIGIAGGWWLARKSLAPIADIARAAQTISHTSLSQRIPVQGTDDELDQLGQVLNHMLDRLEEAFRRIRQFSSDLAHELRTPLTALKGEAERALVGQASADELRTLIAAHAETYDRLNGMLTDLLSLGRRDPGPAPPRHRTVDLADCVRDVEEMFTPVAEQAGITLQSQWPEAECSVHGNDAALRRLVSNLLDNAIKNTPAGGTLFVSVNPGPPRTVIVRDTGRGIQPKDLPHVFERFYRGDPSRSRETGGFGLGLSICKQLVEAHQGTIAIQSEPGQGTTVTVRLPPTPTANTDLADSTS